MPVALPVALSIVAAVVVLLTSAVILFGGALQAAGPGRLVRREPRHPAEEAAIARARQRLRRHG